MTTSASRIGRTTLTGRALRHLVTGLARDAGAVDVADIAVSINDVDGELAVTVQLPFVLDPMTATSLPQQGAVLRDRLLDGLQHLAGRQARTVDVRFTSVRRADRKRVT